MNLQEKEQQIIDAFAVFDDWLDKYGYIIDMGKELPAMDSRFKTNENLVETCQSRVWIIAEKREGRLYFLADSDALISKGVISMLVKIVSGETPEDILNADLRFLKKIGLIEHLSPARVNGLAGMIQRIQDIAKQNISA
jgi:cysteine desulfuration protein SufE